MTVDWTKPIQTRDGRKARVLATDLGDDNYPIVVAVTDGSDHEYSATRTLDGRISIKSEFDDSDVINVTEEITFYLNVYRYTDGSVAAAVHTTEQLAKRKASFTDIIAEAYPVTVKL